MIGKRYSNSNLNSLDKKITLMKKSSILDVRHFLRHYNIDLENYDFEKFITLLQVEPHLRSGPIKITIASYLDAKNLIELLKKENSQDMNFQNILYSISECLTVVTIKGKEILFRINDTADNFYIILKGRVSVLKPIKKTRVSFYKSYFNFLLNLIETNEIHLFKLNLKANSDIFFNSPEEFEIYRNMLKKMKLKELCYESDINKDNIITVIKKELSNFELSFLNLNEESLNKLKSEDEEKFVTNVRKIFDVNTAEENEIFTKYNTLINFIAEQKNFIFYEYEKFTELRTKQFFGDFALDAPNKKRTATIVACEETILGCIPGDTYNKYIQAEKIRYRGKDVSLLNNFMIFKHIKQIHFEKNYFQDFAPFEYEKDQIIFRQGEIIDKLYIIKSGAIDLYLNSNLVEINLLIKSLILKAKSKGIFSSAKAKELMDSLYDGLNVTNKSASYFQNLLKKNNFHLFTCTQSEAPGIESILLGIPLLFKGTIKSDKCKIFKLDNERMNIIIKNYQECKKEYLDLVENKLDYILSRLFNIKKCLVSQYSIEYELQTKSQKMKIDNQLKRIENASSNQNQENYMNKNDNFNSDIHKAIKDLQKTASIFRFNNDHKLNLPDDNENNTCINLNKESVDDIIANFRPYKNYYRKKKPQPEKIKINFLELSEKKLGSNKNLFDIQNHKNKITNELSSNKINNELLEDNKINNVKNNLVNPEEKTSDNINLKNSK